MYFLDDEVVSTLPTKEQINNEWEQYIKIQYLKDCFVSISIHSLPLNANTINIEQLAEQLNK